MCIKSQVKNNVILIVTAVLILLSISLIITYGSQLFPELGIPTWDDIFAAAGLKGDNSIPDDCLSVHFIDVGQGDCILIKTQQGSALIDAGDTHSKDSVLRYLYNQNIKDLQYIFVTHPGSDHIGSMPEVLNSFPVSKIVMSDIRKEDLPTTRIYEKLLNTIYEKKIKAAKGKPGDVFELGDVKISVIAPLIQTNDLNNMSLVLRISYGNNTFLLTGDAEFKSENDILKSNVELKSDVLKAGHHGSKSSCSDKFLKKVEPDFAVISCGRGNSFGHPTKETMDRLTAAGAKILRTDFNGSIVFVSDGNNLYYLCERD